VLLGLSLLLDLSEDVVSEILIHILALVFVVPLGLFLHVSLVEDVCRLYQCGGFHPHSRLTATGIAYEALADSSFPNTSPF
jgi:hypothetical protein